MPNRERNASIDFLRGIAVLIVVLAHYESQHLGIARNIIEKTYLSLNDMGGIGVSIFFCISGFVIMKGYLKRLDNSDFEIGDFYIRRISRIFPLLILHVLIGIFCVFLFSEFPIYSCIMNRGRPFSLEFFFSIVTFTFNWLRLSVEPGWGLHWDILWSLSVEEQFYLVFPILLILIGYSRRFISFLFAIILFDLILHGILLLNGVDSFSASAESSYGFAQIAVGMLGAAGSHTLTRQISSLTLRVAGAILFLFTFYILHQYYLIISCNFICPLMLTLSVSLFLAGNQQKDWCTARILWPIRAIGELSYGAYLYHPAVLFFLAPLLAGMDLAFGFVILMPATVLVTYLSFRFFEQPTQTLIRAWWHKRKALKLRPAILG